MRYSCVVIAVRDIHASRAFYEELFDLKIFQDYGINIAFHGGLALQQEFDWMLDIPKDQISMRPNNMELCFEEAQFDDFVARLRKRTDVELLHDVKEHGWGQRTIRFYDPDKHIIEVGEDMKMVIRRFLDAGMGMEQVSKRMDASVSDLQALLDAQ